MKSYAFVGLGGRSANFYEALCQKYKDNSVIVSVCEKNQGRLNLAHNYIKNVFPQCESYLETEFDEMLRRHKPDCVIVCTIDRYHDDYICRALEAGCDVITEKPMTIDENRCQRIIDTVKKTNRKVQVTFNYRYSPARSQIKQLLMDGVIGKINSVSFQWNLDTSHGADYFRRWHRMKRNSGGLLVHKSTHHFDLVNWWLGDVPSKVYAVAKRQFYTEAQADRYGLTSHGKRCYECSVSSKCNFYLDMTKYDSLKNLYLDNEKYDGYYRDSCIFTEDGNIEDTMNVIVDYRNGAVMTYCLNAFQPWEGYKIEFNGTKGRLEHTCRESSYINGDGSVQGEFLQNGTDITVYPHFRTPYSVEIDKIEGGHGGGDPMMLEDIFGIKKEDGLGKYADYIQGSYSILVGIAANKSIETDKPVYLRDLVNGLGEPGYPINNGQDEYIEFVSDAKYKHEMSLKN